MTNLGLQFTAAPQGDQGVGVSVSLEPVSTKSQIADALVACLQGFPKLNYVKFDEVKLYAADFHDYELPAAQFIDNTETVTHWRGRKNAVWFLTLEVVNKPNENGRVSQKDMWNLEYQIARTLFKKPKLGLPNVVQMSYNSNYTDLHMLEPYYLLRMELQIEYFENLTQDCC